MTWVISITAAITVAVTARLIHLLFLSGKTITNASFFGRFVSRTETARQAFTDGWRQKTWRYLVIAYPCILASIGLASLFVYWMMPTLGNRDGFGDMVRYSLLVFGVGVSTSLLLTFVLIFLVYFVACLVKAWWNPDPNGVASPSPSPE